MELSIAQSLQMQEMHDFLALDERLRRYNKFINEFAASFALRHPPGVETEFDPLIAVAAMVHALRRIVQLIPLVRLRIRNLVAKTCKCARWIRRVLDRRDRKIREVCYHIKANGGGSKIKQARLAFFQ